MYSKLSKTYNPYIEDASPEAKAIYHARYDDFTAGIHKQIERNSALIEFYVRLYHADEDYSQDAKSETPRNYPYENIDMPYFSQWDARWAFNTYAGSSFGQAGCGPTCLAMVYSSLTRKIMTPQEMGEFAIKNSYAIEDNGSSWLLMQEGAEILGLNVEVLGNTEAEYLDALNMGKVLILILGPGHFTSSGHFIVVHSASGKNLQIYDPFNIKNNSLNWTHEEIAVQIRYTWAYTIS